MDAEVKCPDCAGEGVDPTDHNCALCEGIGWIAHAKLKKARGHFSVGFTGTQTGMTEAQCATIAEMVLRLAAKHGGLLRVVHGDCVGADADFDLICRRLEIWRGIYPSNVRGKQAGCEGHGALELAPPAPPLERNHRIVRAGRDLLIAAPLTDREETRSGTWATVRHARTRYANERRGRIVIVWPSGRGEVAFPEEARRELRL